MTIIQEELPYSFGFSRVKNRLHLRNYRCSRGFRSWGLWTWRWGELCWRSLSLLRGGTTTDWPAAKYFAPVAFMIWYAQISINDSFRGRKKRTFSIRALRPTIGDKSTPACWAYPTQGRVPLFPRMVCAKEKIFQEEVGVDCPERAKVLILARVLHCPMQQWSSRSPSPIHPWS